MKTNYPLWMLLNFFHSGLFHNANDTGDTLEACALQQLASWRPNFSHTPSQSHSQPLHGSTYRHSRIWVFPRECVDRMWGLKCKSWHRKVLATAIAWRTWGDWGWELLCRLAPCQVPKISAAREKAATSSSPCRLGAPKDRVGPWDSWVCLGGSLWASRFTSRCRRGSKPEAEWPL